MNSLTVDSEAAIRLLVFISALILLAALEHFFPRRPLKYSKVKRWLSNFGISVFNTLLTRLLIPIAGVAAAIFAAEQNLGLLNLINLPVWLSIIGYLLVFDLAIYFQHRLFHAIPVLWRLHRMHHTDMDYDVSTGNRFHPLSIVISSVIKLALIFIIGPLPVAVIAAEVLLNATSMFNHSNLKINLALDRALRYFLVTPDMHRVHHSSNPQEHSKNFGFNFPWWDKLFGSYKDQPELGHDKMEIGIRGFTSADSIGLGNLLVQPLIGKTR
jgi:sterol desaturase/sphingolipid hydroxylase (fatty acid hydroxylase superfamily)